MSINLPPKVVWFLGAIGVNWPAVDEDQVRTFAGHVRDFGNNVSNTHQSASSVIQQMGQSYSGQSYEQLVTTWGRMSSEHMTQLVSACGVVATALETGADVIVGVKIVAIAELLALATAAAADQVAAVATLGLAEAGMALVVLAARRAINIMIAQAEQYVIGQVIEAAITPLEGIVASALNGLVFQGLEAALGVPAAAGGAGKGFTVVPEALTSYANQLRGYADQVATHATTFTNATTGVSFGA